VAALAGLEMRLKGWKPLVTTFGEPMIGNAAFVDFINRQFQVGISDNEEPETRRFRRVTHVDDPVPLLPLREWGYAPHAGEIYISSPGLFPVPEDVRFCFGDEDPECMAGSETSLAILQDIRLSLDLNSEDPCTYENVPDAQQVVIGKKSDCDDSRSGWNWSLFPARYRLWELFYAHRDYFWRIGLCVPGGDPTG